MNTEIETKLSIIEENDEKVYNSGKFDTLKKSEYAHPIVSGETIAANDVNEIKHKLDVAVKSKNLFDINTERYSGNGTSTLDENNIFTITSPKGMGWPSANFKIPFPETLVGRKITISAKAKSSTGNEYAAIRILYFNGSTAVSVSGMGEFIAKTNSTEFTDISVTGTVLPLPEEQTGYLCISLYANAGGAFGSVPVSYYKDVQIEIGTDKTEYTPYVDVSNASMSKNLLDISKISEATGSGKIIISEVGTDYIIVTSTDAYTGNGIKTLGLTLKQLCPEIVSGQTYTLSGITDSSHNTFVYLSKTDLPSIQWAFGKSKLITDDLLDYTVNVYGLRAQDGEGTGDCRISNLQIELGSTPTDYETYGPIGVSVSRLGKNLFDISKIHNISTILINNGDGTITLNNGNSSVDTKLKLSEICPDLKVNDVAVISLRITNSVQDAKPPAYIYLKGDNTTWKTNQVRTITQEMLDSTVRLYSAWYVVDGSTADVTTAVVSELQIEYGSTATAYEEYKQPQTTTANSEGIVEGLTSLSPNMTLISDTKGVIIDCKYYRDIDKYIDNLITDVATSGGE